MKFHDLCTDLTTTPDELLTACRRHGFMVLPYEPSDADLATMRAMIPLSVDATKDALRYAKGIYLSLVSRRKNGVEVGHHAPTKAPHVRQDEGDE